MSYISAKQLAFILDIKQDEARAKMCNAWEKAHGIQKVDNGQGPALRGATRGKKNKIEDQYPVAMNVSMIAEQCNLPGLQMAMDDIRDNYLKRPGSKKYILCDYPEKIIKKAEAEGKALKISIPSVLIDMLPPATVATIKDEWSRRFPKAIIA